MENFVIVKKEKENNDVEIIPNEIFKNNLEKMIDNGEVTVVHGPSGCGKSFMTRNFLKNYQFVEFNCDVLKSKSETHNFIEKVQGTHSVWLFDDLDATLPGWKIAAEYIENPTATMGPVVIVTREELRIMTYLPTTAKPLKVTPPKMSELMKIKNTISKISNLKFLKFWDGSNIRNFINSLKCYTEFGLIVDKQDTFYSTKESVDELICEGGKGYKEFIGKGIEEHGHTQDLIFTNYKAESIEDCAKITESFSKGDEYDNAMYAGNWDFLPYFTLEACVIPSKYIKNKIKKEDMKPGSAWTKCYNMKMRQKQLIQFISRNSNKSCDIDFLNYLGKIFQNISNEEFLEIVKNYNFEPCDIDLMKHISLKTELKGRRIFNIKKALKEHVRTHGGHQEASRHRD